MMLMFKSLTKNDDIKVQLNIWRYRRLFNSMYMSDDLVSCKRVKRGFWYNYSN